MHTPNIFTSSPLTVVPTAIGFAIWEENQVDLGFSQPLAMAYLTSANAEELAYLFASSPQLYTAIEATLQKLYTMPLLMGLLANEITTMQNALQIASLCQIISHQHVCSALSMRKRPVTCATLKTKRMKLKEWLSRWLTLRLWRKSGSAGNA